MVLGAGAEVWCAEAAFALGRRGSRESWARMSVARRCLLLFVLVGTAAAARDRLHAEVYGGDDTCSSSSSKLFEKRVYVGKCSEVWDDGRNAKYVIATKNSDGSVAVDLYDDSSCTQAATTASGTNSFAGSCGDCYDSGIELNGVTLYVDIDCSHASYLSWAKDHAPASTAARVGAIGGGVFAAAGLVACVRGTRRKNSALAESDSNNGMGYGNQAPNYHV